jgi:flavorubredoxin
MSSIFPAIPIARDVYWVGAVDWDIRDFHGYATSRGTTYNAYLIIAEKITLIDAVKKQFQSELLQRIASVIPPEKIDYIVSNHAEMDHSGCLREVADLVKPDKIFTSAKGIKALKQHLGNDLPLTPVKDGDRVDLGGKSLLFMETPMLHWPESMFSYLEEERLLFSQDALGMHLATGERFADEIPDYILEFEAAKYYANILLPYSKLVRRLLDKIGQQGLTFDIIAPDHGPVWRHGGERVLGWYDRWCEPRPSSKVIVAYDTMWGSTATMARVVAGGLREGGARPKLMPLGACHRSDVATEILEAGGLVVGSPTLNSNLFPTVADLMVYLRGLKPPHLVGAAFGSYGWACKSVPQIEEFLRETGVEIVSEAAKAVYVPDEAALLECNRLGREVAEAVMSRCED